MHWALCISKKLYYTYCTYILLCTYGEPSVGSFLLQQPALWEYNQNSRPITREVNDYGRGRKRCERNLCLVQLLAEAARPKHRFAESSPTIRSVTCTETTQMHKQRAVGRPRSDFSKRFGFHYSSLPVQAGR